MSFQLSFRSGVVAKLIVSDVAGADKQKVRLHIESPLSEEDIAALPIGRVAVESGLSESRTLRGLSDDGADTTILKFKRDFAPLQVAAGDDLVFLAQPASTFEVRVVEGVVQAFLRLDTELDADQIGVLAGMVGREVARFEGGLLQGDLFRDSLQNAPANDAPRVEYKGRTWAVVAKTDRMVSLEEVRSTPGRPRKETMPAEQFAALQAS